MGMEYWILEYGKVFFFYVFLMYIWPTVVFNKYLRKKSVIYHFSFCVTVQIVLINTVVLLLGVCHLLNRYVVAFVFYGVFFVSLRQMEEVKKLRGLLSASNGINSKLLQSIEKKILLKIKMIWNDHISARIWEYIILLILLIFGMIYFSYGVFQIYSYGFSDTYVHHQWIYGLSEGKIFFGGIYPEGMHCFVFCLYAISGIDISNILLFIQCIHVTAFLLSAYALLREVFHWRYTPLFVLALYLTLDHHFVSYSMSRLQGALPLEFALHTLFLCTRYLIRYLDSTQCVIWKNRKSKFYWDENLLLFMMALSASIAIHFYATIMAFFVCISFTVFYLKKLFTFKHLIPFAASILCGCFIAAAPMAGALASGIPFQGSIYWGLSSFSSKSDDESQDIKDENNNVGEVDNSGEVQKTIGMKIIDNIKAIYTYGFLRLYGENAEIIFIIVIFSIIISIVVKLRFHKRMNRISNRYFSIILASIVFILNYIAPHIGLPLIINDMRFCSSGHMMILAVMMIPIDIIFSLASFYYKGIVLHISSFAFVISIYAATNLFGVFHGFLFFWLTRYNSAVMVTNSIIDEFPKYSYTIVSPTEELYQIASHGWHEELLDFVKKYNDKDYVIPTKYVFFYVEKKPIKYVQIYYVYGPSWLGNGSNTKPDIKASKISEEDAQKELMEFENPWFTYTYLESRTIAESKAYEWCQKFSQLHPSELKVYYEDEDFVCYYFKQDPSEPFDLGLD